MLRRLGIRGKVLATLSVPVLVLFVLAGIVSNQAIQDAQTARATERLLEALTGARGLTQLIQAERAVTLGAMVGDPEAAQKMPEVRAMVDGAIAASTQAAASIDLTGLDPLVERALIGLDDQSEQLLRLRELIDGERISPRAAFQGFTTMAERIGRFPGVVSTSLQDRRLGVLVQAQTDVVLLQEKYIQEQLFGGLVHAGLQSAGDSAVFLGLFPATNVAQETATLSVEGLGIEDLEVPPLRMGLGQYGSLRAIAAGSLLNFTGLGNPQQWQLLSQDQIDSYDDVIAEMDGLAFARASQAADDATRTAIITIALSVLAVVLSIVIAFAISRGIVIPLRRLTAAAGHVRDELPRLVEQVAIPGQGPDLSLARIPVRSDDEVGQLARAFNEVNATTIEVAQEQAALRASIAEMFVNVARRDQVLLNRQLSFIDALERTEEDPATLADLFRLDHLATRMRRNAESLLVLAGIDTGRRLREPLPLSDVIRTASSEIEHYERIQLDLPVDPLMLGHTALPAAHLLAELLENATVFSDPGTPVHVSTGREAEHMVVTVFDQGLGMTPEELKAANDKIGTTSASDVLGAERLGLFVVGRIASRLGASVQLAPGPDGTGTLATARFPIALFVAPESVPLTAPNQHAARIESFVAPEAAADPSLAMQDVAPGSVGSYENPAEPVDIAQLTAGTTEHGLPKRRSREDAPAAEVPTQTVYREHDDAAAARSIPLAPRAEDLAGAAAFPSLEEEAWTPPVIEAQPLTVRRRTEDEPPAAAPTESADLPSRAPSSGLPTRAPAAPEAGGLPMRAPATGATPLPARTPATPVPPAAPAAAAAVDPQERASMFTGFRSRRAELAAASLGTTDPTDATDGAERLAAAASGAAAFFGRSTEAAPRTDDAQAHAPGQDAPAHEAPAHEAAAHEAPAHEAAEQHTPAAQHAPAPAVEAEQGTPWPRFAPADPVGAEDRSTADGPVEPETSTGSVPSVGAPLTRRARRGRHAYYPEDQPDTPAWAPTPSAEETPAAPAWSATSSYSATAEPVADAPAYEETPSYEQGPSYEQALPQGAAPFRVPALADEPEHAGEHAVPAAEQTWIVPALEQDEAAPGWDAPVEEQYAPAQQHEQYAPADQQHVQADQHYVQAEPQYAPADQYQQVQWVEEEPAQAAAPAEPEHTPSWTAAAPAAPAAPAWPTTEQATTDWSAPQGSWAGPTVGATPSEPVETPQPKRRWWQRRRKAETPSAPQATPIAAPEPTSAAAFMPPATPAPASVPPPAATAPAEAAPTRQSAWGPPQTGTHSGAGAFFAPRPEPTAPATPPTPAPAAWDVPAPHSAPEAPIQAPQDAAAPGAWAPTPVDQWAQAKPPVEPAEPAPAPGPAPAPEPQATSFEPARTTFTPQLGLDDDVASMLAQRADLAQQALAELSQLSTYRPQTVAGGGSSLARRTPGTIPAAPEIKTRSAERPARDANQVRSLLSSFQSGTVRGREAADAAGPQTAGAPRTGAEDDGSTSELVGDPDLTQRSTTW